MFRNLLANMSPAVKNILILNVIFFFAQWALPQIMPSLMLFPFSSENFEPWQLATHFFMHGGIGHLFFNMFALVIFGSNLERVWGPKRFLIYYIACAFGAALIHMLVNYLRIKGIEAQLSPLEINQVYEEGLDLLNTGYNYKGIGGELNSLLNSPMLGASGAVFGLLAAFGYLFPNTELMLLFPPIPIKAKFFVIGYAVLELYLGFSNNPTDNVAHFAHLGGALVGIIIVIIWQRNKNQFF
jgi:membrane associated rhomboid family serine protease